jgi:hypothetical protein
MPDPSVGRRASARRSSACWPGLQIVIVQPSGEQEVVCWPPSAPLIEGATAPEVEPVPPDLENGT